MLGIIIGIFLFLLTIPIKTVELGMKVKEKGKNIKDKINNTLSSDGEGEGSDIGSVIKGVTGTAGGAVGKAKGVASKVNSLNPKIGFKVKNKKGKATGKKGLKDSKAGKAVTVAKKGIKLTIKALKALVMFIRSIAAVISALGAFTTLIIIFLVLVLIAIIAGVFLVVLNDGGIAGDSSSTASGTDAQSESSDGGMSDEEAAESWLKHCDKVYKLMLDSKTTYSQTNWTKIKIDDKEYKWRPDCSGTVAVYLCSYGEIDSTSHTVGTLVEASYKSFQVLQIGKDIKEPDDLRAGDIFAATDKHVLIITKYDADTDTASGYNMPGTGHTVEEWSNKVTKSGNYFKISGTSSGNYDYVIRPKGYKKAASGDWVFYFQGQSPWGSWDYTGINSATYQGQACGLTSTSMVVATYAQKNGADINKEVTVHKGSDSGGSSSDPSGACRKVAGETAKVPIYSPPALREKGYEKFGYIPYTAGERGAIPDLISLYPECKITCTSDKDGAVDLDELDKVLAKGGCMIACYGKPPSKDGVGVWTERGHYVVIRGGNQKDGYDAADPNLKHDTGESGIKEWAPYREWKFDKAYVEDTSYYYFIEPK